MIEDRDTDKNAEFVKRILNVYRPSVIDGGSVETLYRYRPGYPFEVTDCQVHCSELSGVVQLDVQRGNQQDGYKTILNAPVAPVADEIVVGELLPRIPTRRGRGTDEIHVVVTTEAGANMSNLNATIAFRKNPLGGEASFAR